MFFCPTLISGQCSSSFFSGKSVGMASFTVMNWYKTNFFSFWCRPLTFKHQYVKLFTVFLIKECIIVHYLPKIIISIFGLHAPLTYAHLSLHLFDHLFRVLVHSFDKGAHVLWFHVGVKAVAQVGDVAPRAETLQHLLHDVWDALLKEREERRTAEVKDRLADIFRSVMVQLNYGCRIFLIGMCVSLLKLGQRRNNQRNFWWRVINCHRVRKQKFVTMNYCTSHELEIYEWKYWSEKKIHSMWMLGAENSSSQERKTWEKRRFFCCFCSF